MLGYRKYAGHERFGNVGPSKLEDSHIYTHILLYFLIENTEVSECMAGELWRRDEVR